MKIKSKSFLMIIGLFLVAASLSCQIAGRQAEPVETDIPIEDIQVTPIQEKTEPPAPTLAPPTPTIVPTEVPAAPTEVREANDGAKGAVTFWEKINLLPGRGDEMPITIRDVAKRLSLSITTVSRALDGYDDVSEETRQRVRQAALEIGYFPNQAARHLRRQRSDAIGHILPAAQPRFTDPFFSEFIAGLGDEVAQNKVDLVISAAPPDSDQEKCCTNPGYRAKR